MSRQNLLVTLVTAAVLFAFGVVLYGGGSEDASVAERSEGAGRSEPRAPRRLDPAKLVRERPVPADRPAAPDGAPNVVFMMASTQRRDQWTLYGGPEQTTPFISERARAAGVWFEDALAVAVDPHPTAAAILTGRHPHALGVVELGPGPNRRSTPADATTLAEVFAAAGWFTVGLSANHHVNTRAGLSQGFDWYRDSQPLSLKLGARIDAATLVRVALARVARRSEPDRARPLFLQLAFVDSHKPFRVPPKEFERFERDESGVGPYRATLRRLDDAVRALVTGLESHGVTESNTLFVIVADHGEGLERPKAHRFQHGFVLYGSSVQIPLAMWGHDLPEGRAVPGLVSQIDVLPTLLSHLGLPVPDEVDGVDHSDALAEGRSQRERAYAEATYRGIHRASLWTTDRQCQKDFGSVRELPDDAFVDGCFDRAADPDFTTVIEEPGLMAELEQAHAARRATSP